MQGTRKSITAATSVAVVSVLLGWGIAQGPTDPLEAGFRNPPERALPRTWWHWTGGNVTKEGITRDLEWMKRVGIGGFQLADVSVGSGQSVDKKIEFGSPAWLDAVRHSAAEADRLGLEMAIFSSAGWSETGGPWVKPEQAMKKIVWSETRVDGPRRFSGTLPHPPSENGPIRNLSRGAARAAPAGAPAPPSDPTCYGDSAVVAYRTPEAELSGPHDPRTAVTPEGVIDATALLDDDLNSSVILRPREPGGPAWIQYEFASPLKVRAVSVAGRNGIPVGRLMAGNDPANLRTLVVLPGPQGYRGGPARTFAFDQISAKFFRLELSRAALSPAAVMNGSPPQPAPEYTLNEFVLHSGGRVNRWEDKAGFSLLFEYESSPTPATGTDAVIRRSELVELTERMREDGFIDWDVPPGHWTILRIGWSLTGAKNRPATRSGLGYEADKLSRSHMEAYFRGYADPIARALGPLFGRSLRYFLIDSWEAGMQNWTDGMIGEFRARRGYDPTPLLPVLAGRVVDSAETSDRFLWDFRRSLADMFADNHYGVLEELLQQRGLGTYSEASGVSLEILEDTLLNKSKVDIPMGEFWMRALHPESMYYEDVRGAASASHAYGKNLVAAEAFTGGGYEAPYSLKKVADLWFTEGVNRLVIHTSAHQPLDTKPGNTMVGTHVNRNITWAEQAGPLMQYLARTSFMLQQGRFVADLAYLLPEGAPSTMPFWGPGLRPIPPDGYDFDYVNTDVLLNRMSVDEDGRLLLPDGMTYRALVLPRSDKVTPPVMRKIRELVAGGATVVGPKPAKSPSLVDYPEADSEVQSIAADVWGGADGIATTRHSFGKGQIVWGRRLPEVLTSIGVTKDFEYGRGLGSELSWIHRRLGDTDIYFLVNRTDRALHTEARFRVEGKAAEFWRPDTGTLEPAEYAVSEGTVTVPLTLSERESLFVVFRGTASSTGRRQTRVTNTPLAVIGGPWEVRFEPGGGAPERVTFRRLESWTSHSNDRIKYYSGTATYLKTVEARRAWFRPGAKVLLDLGTVKDLAEVRVNGAALPILWKPPFRADVTDSLRPGTNRLEIKVTNEWTNRLLGDRLLPPDKRVLSASAGAAALFGRRQQQPTESGLLGPLMVISAAQTPPPPALVVAGIPVNYDEEFAGDYSLPDPLEFANGSPVRDSKAWLQERRPEIVRLFEENQFGRAPGRPPGMTFEVFDRGSPAFDGKALRRQVTVNFAPDGNGPKMDLLVYLPAAARKPVPLLLHLSFSANSSTVDDPGVKVGEIWNREKKRIPATQGRSFGRVDVVRILERGFGFATVYYGDIDPDFQGGVASGVRGMYLKGGQTVPEPGEWGAIAAWAWGLSRALDYFETDSAVDSKRVAIMGVSRLGKTVLWAGARDTRFAMVIASCSGEGGAALSRRNYGETIAHLTEPTRYPYQFCANYGTFAYEVDRFPVDSHMLLALIAPRPVLLQTGDRDYWSDPKGEFLAAVAATPVFRLLGAEGLGITEWPPAGQPVLTTLGYYMHSGGHGTIPSDWEQFLRFMERHLAPVK